MIIRCVLLVREDEDDRMTVSLYEPKTGSVQRL